MLSDEYLVECKIDDDDDDEEEVRKIQPCRPPPPHFSSTPPSHVDLRDPCGINKHLKVEFSDVLAEPVSSHSYDRVWVYSGIAFDSARLWGYRGLSALCAVPVSCLCGCLFALLACLHIWCVMPCLRACHVCLPCVRSLWMSVVSIFITPLCVSVARCCRSVHLSTSKD